VNSKSNMHTCALLLQGSACCSAKVVALITRP
jgi:hypothetical protein